MKRIEESKILLPAQFVRSSRTKQESFISFLLFVLLSRKTLRRAEVRRPAPGSVELRGHRDLDLRRPSHVGCRQQPQFGLQLRFRAQVRRQRHDAELVRTSHFIAINSIVGQTHTKLNQVHTSQYKMSKVHKFKFLLVSKRNLAQMKCNNPLILARYNLILVQCTQVVASLVECIFFEEMYNED